MPFTLVVSGFAEGESIPRRHTCDGGNTSPALNWRDAPEATQSFALIVDDPDAPAGTWNHWLLWDIPAHQHSLPENFQPGMIGTSGKNDFGHPGYGGPCPPKGHGPHRYSFTIYALDRSVLGLPANYTRADLDRALKGRILAQSRYIGHYERP